MSSNQISAPPLATSYRWASASIRDTESVCELYPRSICAILHICQLLPGRGLVLDCILHIFLLDLTYSNETRLNLVEEMRHDSAPAVLRHKQIKHVQRSKGVEGIAEDRRWRRPYVRSRCSRSISSDGRWCRCAIRCCESQQDPFVSAENWKSPLQPVSVFMSTKCSFTLRQHVADNCVNPSRNYPR